MSKIEKIINEAKKIVIKLGSNVLSTDEGMPDNKKIENIAAQVKEFMDMGKQVILVSSGAGICGVGAINKWSRRKDMSYKQALCAIGQVELMMSYKKHFALHGIHVGQMLLTKDDFESEERKLHIRNTLFTLVDEGVVPIINENDSVSVDEIKIGDNDNLSALTASIWNSDVLIILSDIDGIFDKDPKQNIDAKLIEEIASIEELVKKIDISGKSEFGTGGIQTKLQAAEAAGRYGIQTVLLNGKNDDILRKAARGDVRGSIFLA